MSVSEKMPRDLQSEINNRNETILTAHDFLRGSLELPEDAPYRFDYYAQKIDEIKEELKERTAIKFPVVVAYGFFIKSEETIQDYKKYLSPARVITSEDDLQNMIKRLMRTHMGQTNIIFCIDGELVIVHTVPKIEGIGTYAYKIKDILFV